MSRSTRADEIAIITQKNKHIKNKSGYKGVYKSGKETFRAKIRFYLGNNKNIDIDLGSYNSPEEASKARTEYLKSLI